jgi:uncharacterized protein
MSIVLRTAVLLVLSNVFMNLSDRPWYIAALVSWGIAGAVYFVFRGHTAV